MTSTRAITSTIITNTSTLAHTIVHTYRRLLKLSSKCIDDQVRWFLTKQIKQQFRTNTKTKINTNTKQNKTNNVNNVNNVNLNTNLRDDRSRSRSAHQLSIVQEKLKFAAKLIVELDAHEGAAGRQIIEHAYGIKGKLKQQLEQVNKTYTTSI
jgi:hypothetical protein